MKPDGSANENLMEPAEVEPSEFFVELGMLIVESRLPAQSVKGRQDGPHCPSAVGDRSFHTCDAREPLCKKASEMQRQIQVLWRNHIPMCIEVLLFPDCAHGLQKATSTDAVAPPVTGDGCILLEQWTIQMTAKRLTEGCISSRALLQAMRSYLHFSQLSAWLNLSHGTEPRHVGYRISPPAEFCTSTFSNTPENHLFPLASVNKLTNIKVTLSHLPRLSEIPKPLCREVTGKQVCSVIDYLVTRLPRSSSPKPGVQVLALSGSPKLDKPNVLHAMSAEEREILTRPSKCLCCECLGSVIRQSDIAGSQSEQGPDVVKSTGGSFSSSLGHFEESWAPRPTAGSGAESSEGSRPIVKDSGAVPKRLSLQLKSIPEDILAQHPRSPQHPKASQLSSASDDGDETTASQKQSSFKRSIPTLLPPFMNQYTDLIPEVLPNSCLFLDGDSCSPSPDFDHFLSKTLMKQSEPLTLEEMEKYLHHLYLPGSDTARPPGINGYSAAVRTRKLKARHSIDGKREGKVPSAALCESNASMAKSSSDFHDENKTFDSRDFKTEQNCGQSSAETTISDHSIGRAADRDWPNSLPRLAENSHSVAPSCGDRTVDYRPTFTVGDAAENDGKAGYSEATLAALSPAIPVESPHSSPVSMQEGGLTPNPGASSPRTLHKSTSCPSKPSFRGSGGGSRVSSLLKTVMKKEMMTHEESVAVSNEVSVRSPRVPTDQERIYFGRCVQKSASMVFHATTGLPLQSSPVPTKKLSSGSFDYDGSLNCVRAIKNSLSCFDLDAQNDDDAHLEKVRQSYSTSAPASTNCLLGNFEESLINGRIEPAGVVNGFTVDIGASGSFCPPHLTLPVTAFFFSLSDDHAPSPYLGHINLEGYSKRGYHVPRQGTIQVTLFNPNKTVVKMFVVKYDMSDMPPSHQTVLRQRTLYMPVKGSPSDVPGFMVYLRYLIHLRFASSKSSKIYLHTDIRVIFARDKFELDSRVANYELRSFTEGPENPKFSPRK